MKSFAHIRQRPRSNKGTGVFLATTAAALFATVPVAQAAPQEVVFIVPGSTRVRVKGAAAQRRTLAKVRTPAEAKEFYR